MSTHDPFCWDGSPTPAAGPPAAAPPRRSRRRLTLAAGLGVALAVAVAVVLALIGSGGSGGVTETPLARAAAVTEQASGFKVTLSMAIDAEGQNVDLAAKGAFNTQPLNGSLTMAVDGTDLSEVIVPPDVYVQTPGSSGWTAVDVGSTPADLPASTPAAGPTQELNLLKSVGSVTTGATQTIDGVSTTEYQAVIDVSRAAGVVPAAERAAFLKDVSVLGTSTIPIDVWLDAEGRVRRFTMALDLTTAQGPVSMSMTMNLFDYGPQPPASAPAAADVTSLDSPGTSASS